MLPSTGCLALPEKRVSIYPSREGVWPAKVPCSPAELSTQVRPAASKLSIMEGLFKVMEDIKTILIKDIKTVL